jgi:hypothetical protein
MYVRERCCHLRTAEEAELRHLRATRCEPQMHTDDHGLFPGEVIRGNPRESAASVPPCLGGEGWSGGLGRSPLQGSSIGLGPVDPGRWPGFVRPPLWGSLVRPVGSGAQTAVDLALTGRNNEAQASGP